MMRTVKALAAFGLVQICSCSELRPAVAKAEHESKQLPQHLHPAKVATAFLERPQHHNASPQSHHAAKAAAGKVQPDMEEKPEAAVNDAPATDADESNDDSASLLENISEEVAEVKQTATEVKETEGALKADVAMLRQSTKMHRVARSRGSKLRTKRQVERGEQLVKVATSMVEDSRADAVDAARHALSEAAAIRKAVDELSSEAHGVLRKLGKR
eukprot:TRINITY_DN16259_c0_g1_i1.p2 TRINITY_DN16259_c0_g1~~TRINITY_DN16259_c0_g1_i1.p2  ORF type:complete len:215 (-),score=83.53 TRINITY_DN16259_c0_g1_i1:151-795(-)